MATINISLPSQLKDRADQLVKQGYFVSFSDLVRTALRELVESSDKSLAAYCQRNNIIFLGLFGSYARGEAKKGSDVDILVKFKKQASVGMFDLIRIEKELSKMFNKPVELATKLNKHIKPLAQKDMVVLYEEK